MKRISLILLATIFLLPSISFGEVPWQFSDNTRYMAMGDSLATGYGAIPATNGYVYRVYNGGAFDSIPNTIFANAAVPGATTGDVLSYQLPQASRFHPSYFTLSAGGNDLLAILNGGNPNVILAEVASNLTMIFTEVALQYPDSHLFVNNLYSISEVPNSDLIIPIYNQLLEDVAAPFPNVHVVDVYSAFVDQKGLLLIERNNGEMYQIHPTNAGYRVMAREFTKVINTIVE